MKVLLFANTDWYLYNFRLSLARALRSQGYEVILVSPSGAYGDRLRELGFRWIQAPMNRRSLNPLKEFLLIIWIARLILQEQIDLIHGFTIKCAIYGSLAARLTRRSARISAVAGMGYVFISNDLIAYILRPVVRVLMRLALNGNSSRLILQNPDDVILIERARVVNPEILRLIPGSGVDCQRFKPIRGNYEKVRNPLRVLLSARLLWDKGLAEYVAAARQLHLDGLKINFYLAGDSDAGNPASVDELTVRGWVEEGVLEWLGHVDDMPSLFQSVDIVVLPSYREGLPKSLIEAGACGVCLVTTDVPGCREVVTNMVDGLLIPVKDSSKLASAIARLYMDDALRIRLGEAARDKCLKQFDDRIIINKTIAVYKELLN